MRGHLRSLAKLLALFGTFDNAAVRRHRTSAQEDFMALPELRAEKGQVADSLPGRGMVTYELSVGK
jgi:hypothetical protein